MTSVSEGSIIRPRPRSSISRNVTMAAGAIAAPPGNDNVQDGDAKESKESPVADTSQDSTSFAISTDVEEVKKKEFR